jgi:ketopantoate reductase
VPTWAAPAGGGGKVLQVVTATTTTFTSNATTTYSDTTLTATITPTLNTSTILVLVNQNGIATEDGNASSGVGLKLLRGATDISLIATRATINFTTTGQFGTTLSTAYKDSPATTSATTYKTQFKNNVAANAAYVQIDDVMSTITLLEIGA